VKTLAVVVSVGARTSIGLNAVQTAMNYRAGMAGMTEAAILDLNEEPLTMCLDPTLDPLLVGAGRVVRLALPALDEALAGMSDDARGLRMKLIGCLDEHLAEARPDGVTPASVVLRMLQRRIEELGHNVILETSARGGAGPGFAIGDDLEALARGELDAVLLGGLHSDYDPPHLRRLEEAGRIFTPENLDSMIPGEAAAFAVLMRPDVARRHRCAVRAELHEVATAFEKATPDNEESRFEAIGLTVAVRKVGAVLADDQRKAGWVLTDQTFEMRRVYEWMSMSARTGAFIGEPGYLDSPAQRLGNLGAAAIPLHFVLTCEAWRRGHAPSKIAISYAGSDGGDRAAFLLSGA
jgi:3-oxoacyl-[acyl-carrier-protein] synthase I